MIYSRASYIDRVEITSFNRNIEEDVTLMLVALHDIKKSMGGYCAVQYEINWHLRDRAQPVIDSNGDRVEWCKLQYVDDRWIYCHNNVCMQFSREELKTSILYVRDGDMFVSVEQLLNSIISILISRNSISSRESRRNSSSTAGLVEPWRSGLPRSAFACRC